MAQLSLCALFATLITAAAIAQDLHLSKLTVVRATFDAHYHGRFLTFFSEQKMKRLLTLSAVLTVFAGSAHAAAANFCNAEDGCTTDFTVYVENNASVTVTSVNITQEKGAASCEKVKKTVSRNVAGGTGMDPGQTFRISVNPICKYKVVYKTTKGCVGDKTTHIKPSDFAASRDTVKLLNACGTLNAKVSSKKSDA